jgi:uncharacterized repeat protein (TIGR03803 family)
VDGAGTVYGVTLQGGRYNEGTIYSAGP